MTSIRSSNGAPVRTVRRCAVVLAVLGVVALFTGGPGGVGASARAAEPAVTNCGLPAPAATDGHLTLDRTSVRPGESVLAVLSGFNQWPAGLIGGGSGETFFSCAPWSPNGDAEVLVHDAAALFLIPVPAGTAPGTYDVGVRFYQGSTDPMQLENAVALTASLTVTAGTPTGDSAACRLDHAAATAGSLRVPASVRPGGDATVSVTGVPRTEWLSEYDRLYFVACLDGRATAVTYSGDPSLSFTVAVPSAPGTYDLVVTGSMPDSEGRLTLVQWRHDVVVASASPSPTASPTPSPTPSPTTPPVLAVTGSTTWPLIMAGLALLAAGTCLLLAAGRRARKAVPVLAGLTVLAVVSAVLAGCDSGATDKQAPPASTLPGNATATAPASTASGSTASTSTPSTSVPATSVPASTPSSGPSVTVVSSVVAYPWAWPNSAARPGAVTHHYPVPPLPVLRKISVGEHYEASPAYDRISFTFTGTFPSYDLQWVRELVADASGKTITMDGNDILRIRFTQADAHDASGHSTVQSAPPEHVGYKAINAFAQAGDFEGVLTFGVSNYRTITQSNPQVPVRVLELKTTDGRGGYLYIVAIDIQNRGLGGNPVSP